MEIGRIGGMQSAFSADTRNAVLCEAGRVLETAILVLVSRKGDPFFSATNFSWSHDRLVCPERRHLADCGSSIDASVENLNVRF